MPWSNTCIQTGWWIETLCESWEFLNCEKMNLTRMERMKRCEIPLDLIQSWPDLEMDDLMTWRETDCLWWAWSIVCTKIAPRFDDYWISEMPDGFRLNLWMHLWWRKRFTTMMTPAKVWRICSNDKLVTKIGRNDEIWNQHLNCWITVGWNLWHKEWLLQQTEGLLHILPLLLTFLISVHLGS